MADRTLFSPQTHIIEQTLPSVDETEPENALPVTETAEITPQDILPGNVAPPIDPNAPAPVVQPAQPTQPAPEEEELDELIIEDFTIDGICGVY